MGISARKITKREVRLLAEHVKGKQRSEVDLYTNEAGPCRNEADSYTKTKPLHIGTKPCD